MTDAQVIALDARNFFFETGDFIFQILFLSLQLKDTSVIGFPNRVIFFVVNDLEIDGIAFAFNSFQYTLGTM
ncbi:MAG: hypothetical protein KDA17_02685 [Candidatus Saccharibacteria bacterium]|nr:hypothetical protein [Candidatus Saccharibacteria bacterium]